MPAISKDGGYPCKNCKERYLGCHEKCGAYLQARANKSKEKQKYRNKTSQRRIGYFYR